MIVWKWMEHQYATLRQFPPQGPLIHRRADTNFCPPSISTVTPSARLANVLECAAPKRPMGSMRRSLIFLTQLGVKTTSPALTAYADPRFHSGNNALLRSGSSRWS